MTNGIKCSALLSTLLLIAACGSGSTDYAESDGGAMQLSAATLGEQTVLPAADYLALEPFASADRQNGSRQAQICKACHSLNAGGPNMIGPALFGVFGRNVAGVGGFNYSPAMRDAKFVWTPRALDALLRQPGRFLPGNRMAFSGVFGQQDRDDLIAYLLETTSDRQ
ncbi:MAG: c-type cytochrome [Woeseiaceae bacterium]|nr:c-type cytochrome [Woeseiaceae bacterium]